MARCCGGATCPCVVEAGTGLTVTGTGANGDPFIVGLDADSSDELSTSFDSRFGWVVPMIPTLYYGNICQGAPSSQIPTEAELRGGRITVARDCTITRIGVEKTVAGDTTAVIRLGIYSINTETGAMTRILDASTVSGLGTGFVEATVSQALTAGTQYMLCASVQGAATTRPTLRTTVGTDPFIGDSTGLNYEQSQYIGWAVSGISGALPASIALGSLTPAASGSIPRIAIRTD